MEGNLRYKAHCNNNNNNNYYYYYYYVGMATVNECYYLLHNMDDM